VTIVGVSRTEREIEGEGFWAPNAAVYIASEDTIFTGAMVIRAATDNPGIAAQVRVKLSEVPGIMGQYIGRWDENRLSNIASRGFLAKVFVSMGGVALGLAMLGLYGVLAYAVGRRMREFAVRVALGASPRGLLKMVLHDGFVMLLAGIGVGAFVALVTTRLLDAVLITILPSDVISLVACEAVLVITGLAAAFAPARKASNANPMDILRAV
jgi:ABC-type antimicrobial peptide transport system permease subunit